MDFTRYFFQCLLTEKNAANKELLEQWAVFVKELEIAWNSAWFQLKVVLNQEPLDINQVELLLNDYSLKIQEVWNKQIAFPMKPFPQLILSKEKKDLLASPKQVPPPNPIRKIEEPVKISPPEKEISSSLFLDVFGNLSCGEILAYSMIALIMLASVAGIVIATWGAGAVAGVSATTVLGLSITGAAVGGAGMFATSTYTLFSNIKRKLRAEPVEQMQLKID